MKFIIFGKFSFNHIYFLFYALSTFISRILWENLFDNNIDNVAKNFDSMYMIVFSLYLAVIPYLINKRLSKSNTNQINGKENENPNEVYYLYHQNIKYRNLNISTLRISIYGFLAKYIICLFLFFNDKPEVLSYYSLQMNLIFNTITQYMASHFILNYQFYKHHYLSFAINFCCILILIIIDIFEIVKKKIIDYQYYIYIILYLIKLLLFAFGDNYAKKTLYTEYLSPYSLMLSMAVYESIFAIIFSIPFIFLKTKGTNINIFYEMSKLLNSSKIILSIGLFVCNFLYQMFLIIIMDRFSPSHLCLGFILNSFAKNIYTIIKNFYNNQERKWYYYSNIIIYIILFIAAMIHNEIFIINKCGFNTNTKMFLDLKLNEERRNSEYIFTIEEDNEEDEQSNNQDNISEEKNKYLGEEIAYD